MKLVKKSLLNIQFLIAFVSFVILIISTIYFISNQIPKIEGQLKEKLLLTKQKVIKQKILGYYGLPPNWSSDTLDVKVIGYSLKPNILDYSKILFNDHIIENKGKREQFLKFFEDKVNDKKIQTYWLAYYKIKGFTPYEFFDAYGCIKIKREKWGINISYNFDITQNQDCIINFTKEKPNIFFEFLIIGEIEDVNKSGNFFVEFESLDPNYSILKFDTNNTKNGTLIIRYRNITFANNLVEYIYPKLIIINKMYCKPTKICEMSGFLESNKKIPLIKYFGMSWYRNVVDKYEALEEIDLALLKTFLSNYIVEVHYFIWLDNFNVD